MLSVIILGLVAYSEEAHAATLLIDVDFGTPPHTVGALPVIGHTGLPVLNTVGSVFGGPPAPIVVSSFGALSDQPLIFQDGGSNQVQFFLRNIPQQNIFGVQLPICSKYIIEEDILMLTNGGGSRVFYDNPLAVQINFRAGFSGSGGDIEAVIISPQGDIVGFDDLIGTWTSGQVTNIRSEIDLVNDEWKIFLDNVLVRTSKFGSDTLLQHRFAGALGGSPPNDIGIDNIKISCAEDILPPMMAIGGDMIQMKTTSILAAGAQYNAAWMIPVLVSAIGIGIVVARKF